MGLVHYAARHASQKELDRLATALAKNKKSIGNTSEFARTDVAFHVILAEIPRNLIFTAVNAALSEWLVDKRTVSIRVPVRGAAGRAYEGHEKIYQAIECRDVEAADRMMAEHSKTVAKYRSKAMAEEDE
jgi:DNA-binding FadR family transcriptional regulator